MTSHEIRRAFLDFFENKKHKIVPSAPLVLKNDPTLMFTNSGMVQFKDYFLGNGTPPSVRIADTQKCLRVSGKHNDLEDVGFDGTHHTLFEMLGNWSFGDYFKEDAIAWSWELLTEKLGLHPNRLYATVFGGDSKEDLGSDEEARNYWRKFLPENHILDGSKKDNFWEMGAQGPCGPCSELHYDFRSDAERALVPGETLVNKDHPQVVEIWNLVFMQFERRADGSLIVLPAQHVDTGMGFERLCMVMQGKQFTYDTDVFTPLIKHIEQRSGIKYTGSYDRTALSDVAIRVVADHIRAVAFTIADGQLPASGGAGYVIRRILRRAVRYSYSFLSLKEPFFNTLVPILASEFADVFPELNAQKDFVQKVILEEEKSFLRTLESGLRRMENIPVTNSRISGADAFELFDTYGFPLDLTELIAREKGLSVDTDGFEQALREQKARSRADAAKQVGDWTVPAGGSEEEADNRVDFIGYDDLYVNQARVLKYRKVEDKNGVNYQVVLNKTPFYAESGGQVGDTGRLTMISASGDVADIEVLDTKKENDLIIHVVSHLPEWIDEEAEVAAQVDSGRRAKISKNHSAGHLMHAAFHRILGNHAIQKGQHIDDKRLRFDFAHFAALSKDEIAKIELLVNQKIRENIGLEEVREMPIDDARKSGAVMLFGEKYGENVRVISYNKDFSMELCGGTHVAATGEIGQFKIVSEGAVSAGVRRVEVLTAEAAEAFLNEKLALLNSAADLMKNPKDLLKAIGDLQEENRQLQKEKEQFLMEKASILQHSLVASFESVNGINVLVKKIDLGDAKAVKTLITNLEKEKGNALIVLGTVSNEKPQLTIQISQNLISEKGYHAGNMVRELAKDIQGGGGGQAFFATAGGQDVTGLDKALNRVKSLL